MNVRTLVRINARDMSRCEYLVRHKVDTKVGYKDLDGRDSSVTGVRRSMQARAITMLLQ